MYDKLDTATAIQTLIPYPQRLSEQHARHRGFDDLVDLGYATREIVPDGSGKARYSATDAGMEYLRLTQGNPAL